MRYFEEGAPRPVPKAQTMPFEEHRDMAEVIDAEKKKVRRHLMKVKDDRELDDA